MILWTENDRRFVRHAHEVVREVAMANPSEYTDADDAAIDKLSELGNGVGNGGPVLLVSGQPLSEARRWSLFSAVVAQNLDHWVADASQRLLFRAALVLELDGEYGARTEDDHGDNPDDHALVSDWVGNHYVQRCATCARLFRA